MPLGLFTQAVCLLTDGSVSLPAIEQALRDSVFEPQSRQGPDNGSLFGGAALVVPFRPEMNGNALVDVVNAVWPDEMGDPKTDSATFAAWSMGGYGPFVYPGSFKRSMQHAWNSPECRELAPKHQGFVRFRITYALGAKDSDPVTPANTNAAEELQFLGLLVGAALDLPGVLCVFDPSGETLYTPRRFNDIRRQAMMASIPPLPLWANARIFRLSEAFSIMDTVGNEQLDVSDIEAVFPASEYDPREVSNYLRSVTLYLLARDHELQTGELIDGPGDDAQSWTIERAPSGVMLPPRQVIRVFPKSHEAAVKALLAPYIV